MKKVLAIILGLLFYNNVQAQSVYEIDMKLSALLQQITYWDDYDYHDKNSVTKDSLDKANNDLYNYLLKICIKVPETLHGDLPKAKRNGLTIISSVDKKLRLYAWDSRMGGSEHYYENIAQYRTAGGVAAVDLKDSLAADDGCDYKGISTIYTPGQKAIYLVRNYRIISNKDRRESITAYMIDSGMLKKANIFKTKSKTTCTIAYEYDAIVSERRFLMKEMPTIHLAEDRRKLYIPVVKAGEITGAYRVYFFDGKQFVPGNKLK